MADLDGFLRRLFERERKAGFPSLPDTTIKAWIPLRQSVVDDLLRPALEGRDRGALKGLRLFLTGDDLLRLEVDVATWLFRRTVAVDLRVERYIAFPHDPTLKLTLLTGGVIEFLLNLITLPDFVKIEGKLIKLDLGYLLRRGNLDWLIPRITDARLYVHSGIAEIGITLTTGATSPSPEQAVAAMERRLN